MGLVVGRAHTRLVGRSAGGGGTHIMAEVTAVPMALYMYLACVSICPDN